VLHFDMPNLKIEEKKKSSDKEDAKQTKRSEIPNLRNNQKD
jgi:hypothetical protein